MESDFPSGCILLPEYHRVISALEAVETNTDFESVRSMINVMLPKLIKYQQEAFQCENLLVSTVLNPQLQLKIFELHYLVHFEEAKSVLKKRFWFALHTWPTTPPSSHSVLPSQPKDLTFHGYNLFASNQTSTDGKKAQEGEFQR